MAAAEENVREQKIEENGPLLEEKEESTTQNENPKSKEVQATRPKVSGIPSTGLEEGFYKHFMTPMLSKMEESVQKNNAILDDINRKMKEERDDRRKKQLSKHIPEVLQGYGQDLKDVMQHIQDLIIYENYNKEDNDESKLVKARLKHLDENANVAVLSHSIGAYVSTLEPQHLRHFAMKIVSDTTTWMSRLFRFPDASAYFNEDEREGLVRVCRMVLQKKYPKFSTDGFEALYSRPPVLYVSAASKPGLGQYMCSQLGLPLSCLCTVPCCSWYGDASKMDVAALEKLIQDDIASGKMPLLLVAYAGTPVVGHVDELKKLQSICEHNEIWLHVEGNNLATLTMFSVPTNVLPAKTGDSMTLNMGGWLGLPSIPYTTLYNNPDPNLARSAGLMSFNARHKLNCISLWICLQNLGHEGVVDRVGYTLNLSKMVYDRVNKSPTVKNIVLFEIENPTVVFKYQEPKPQSEGQEDGDNPEGAEDRTGQQPVERDPYFDALNIWLSETLKREVPKVHVTAIEVENEGVCIRFAPMESAHAFDTTEEDVNAFIECLDRQLSILDATVKQRPDFQDIVEAQDNMRLVNLPNWAGVGAVQYISDEWLEKVQEDVLPENGFHEINILNHSLLQQLKSSDTAFSLGQTEEGLYCVRFGLITEDTDLEELIALVYTTGKEVEESSKYLETMADVIREGIEKANIDLQKENQNKVYQEGVLRQVPLVGSFVNWWSPPPKDNAKGRTLNLASGKVESTESTYKYHMQVQEAPPELSPPVRDGPLKQNLRPAKRRSRSGRESLDSQEAGDGAAAGSGYLKLFDGGDEQEAEAGAGGEQAGTQQAAGEGDAPGGDSKPLTNGPSSIEHAVEATERPSIKEVPVGTEVAVK